MIKSKDSLNRGIEIDLTGPDGNAYYILGVAKNLCKQVGIDYKPIMDEMMSGDYENSIAFQTACDLVFKGKEQPSGYTEPLLHFNRLKKKLSRIRV